MSSTPSTHDTLVADWHENAEDRDDENYRFLRSLKLRPPEKVDRIAQELHREAFGIVDCTKCANCCRTLRPPVTEADVARIATHLGITEQDFIAAYLMRDTEGGGYSINAKPCPFLGDDNLCKIYDVRPEKCLGYPYTDKAEFAFMTMTHASNAVTCPAVFHVVEGMKKRLRQ